METHDFEELGFVDISLKKLSDGLVERDVVGNTVCRVNFFPSLVGFEPSSEFEEPLGIDLTFIELVRDGALNARRLWERGEDFVFIGGVNGSDD